jgi:ribosomal protein S18 acetylase RimI-like enzyme
MAVGHRLLAAVVGWLAEGNVRSAQALLPAENGQEHDQLSTGGFLRVADLLLQLCFLDKRSAVPNANPAGRADLVFVPFVPQFRSRLTAILQKTYQGSLDCPVLDRAREMGDVLDGYAAHGDSGTAGWYLIERAGVDAGCLLLAHDRRLGYTELVYMGLVPEARGHGHGRDLVRFAQDVARFEGLLRMSLAVDAGNFPAIAAYEGIGFITWEKKTAYFRRIEPHAMGGK